MIPVQKSLLGNPENIVILLVHLIYKKLYLFLKKNKNFNLFNDCFSKYMQRFLDFTVSALHEAKTTLSISILKTAISNKSKKIVTKFQKM